MIAPASFPNLRRHLDSTGAATGDKFKSERARKGGIAKSRKADERLRMELFAITAPSPAAFARSAGRRKFQPKPK